MWVRVGIGAGVGAGAGVGVHGLGCSGEGSGGAWRKKNFCEVTAPRTWARRMFSSTLEMGMYRLRSKKSITREASTMKAVKAAFSKSVSCTCGVGEGGGGLRLRLRLRLSLRLSLSLGLGLSLSLSLTLALGLSLSLSLTSIERNSTRQPMCGPHELVRFGGGFQRTCSG